MSDKSATIHLPARAFKVWSFCRPMCLFIIARPREKGTRFLSLSVPFSRVPHPQSMHLPPKFNFEVSKSAEPLVRGKQHTLARQYTGIMSAPGGGGGGGHGEGPGGRSSGSAGRMGRRKKNSKTATGGGEVRQISQESPREGAVGHELARTSCDP